MRRKSFALFVVAAMLGSCSTINSGATSSASPSQSGSSPSSAQSQPSGNTGSSEPSSSGYAPSSDSSASAASSLPAIDYVKVFCETTWTDVYAWKGSGDSVEKLAGDWPGTNLQDYDEHWKTYDFRGQTSLNIIFNRAGAQTRDLSIPSAGYWWYYQNEWYNEDPLSQQSSSSESSYTSTSTPSIPEGQLLPSKYRTWYQLLVYSFADSNGDGIGDFKGIANHLDYLQKLGIQGIWLSPIHPSDDYHHYDVKDYRAVDSLYEQGGMTFEGFLAECHNRGIHVIMDLVVNHTSNNHPWRSQHPDYYSGEYVFSRSMPDLNYDNPEVRREIKDIGKYWLNKGVDGFRCDGAAWIYGGGGSWTVEPDKFAKSVQWWGEFSAAMREAKQDVYLVGECWTDLQYVEQFFSSKMSAFNFSMSYWAKDAFEKRDGKTLVNEIVSHQSNVRAKDPTGIEASFLSNHDVQRFASMVNDEAGLKFANAVNVLAPGGSFIYYGDELGMVGSGAGGDRNYRTPMPFVSGRTNSNNYMWNGTESRTKSGNTADADASDANSIFSYTAKAVALKNAYPDLYWGTVKSISTGNNAVGAMEIAGESGKYLLLINAGDNAKTVNILGDYELLGDLSTNGSLSDNAGSISIPRCSLALFSIDGDVEISA